MCIECQELIHTHGCKQGVAFGDGGCIAIQRVHNININTVEWYGIGEDPPALKTLAHLKLQYFIPEHTVAFNHLYLRSCQSMLSDS